MFNLLLINLLFLLASPRKRFSGGSGRNAGLGKITKTFGQGMATLIKDIKQGTLGDDEKVQQFSKKSINRFDDDQDYYKSIGNDTTFYILSTSLTILIVLVILYYIIKVLPKVQEQKQHEQLKKRNKDKYKNYETIRFIAQNGVHPAKAFGKLQKIKHK